MSMQNVSNFFATVEKDNSLQRRIKIATNLDVIVEIAEDTIIDLLVQSYGLF